jgi:hypothetical protein
MHIFFQLSSSKTSNINDFYFLFSDKLFIPKVLFYELFNYLWRLVSYSAFKISYASSKTFFKLLIIFKNSGYTSFIAISSLLHNSYKRGILLAISFTFVTNEVIFLRSETFSFFLI